MTTEPVMTGRQHWLKAESLLAGLAQMYGEAACAGQPPREVATLFAPVLQMAHVHALLADAAPAYAFHQARGEVVADSPNITKGVNEGPNQ